MTDSIRIAAWNVNSLKVRLPQVLKWLQDHERAKTPIDAYPGNKPIATVDGPIVISAATNVAFRPMRSPKCPKSAAPSGRAKKASAKVASDSSVAAAGLDIGKKSFGKTRTAAVE